MDVKAKNSISEPKLLVLVVDHELGMRVRQLSIRSPITHNIFGIIRGQLQICWSIETTHSVGILK